MREVAGYDPQKMKQMGAWALRDVLVAYVRTLQLAAREDYGIALQCWASKTAFGGKSKPPKVPEILR